jgi:hypothetical protein
MDQISKKIASNDKILENISTKWIMLLLALRTSTTLIKMIESQMAQLTADVLHPTKVKF